MVAARIMLVALRLLLVHRLEITGCQTPLVLGAEFPIFYPVGIFISIDLGAI
jgi:hypothetical protein